MDTCPTELSSGQMHCVDGREGFRIEIQALRLKMYALMKELCKLTGDKKHSEYERLEKNTKEAVKKVFWEPPVLIDGTDSEGKEDRTIRPNIFIAYYIYPELLKLEEWDECFEYTLKRLWLSWGGLSTIDKRDKLFYDEYTGENNKSYHRGDSWFWINCLAAICMHRLDNDLGKTIGFTNEKKIGKYKIAIDKIIDACCEEILFKGFIGHHAELSSAKELRSEGCMCQAWSAAMFIELINEIYFNHLKEF
jgi:glycogen debranching enzyme